MKLSLNHERPNEIITFIKNVETKLSLIMAEIENICSKVNQVIV